MGKSTLRLSIASGFMLVFFIHTANLQAESINEIPVGGYLPDVKLQGLLVKSKKFSDYKGKPLIINMWASWCGPCQAEMASIQHLSTLPSAKKFNIIGISTDDDAHAATQTIIQSKLTFENYIDQNLVLEQMLGANAIPLTVFIDANGRVVKKIRGSQQWDSQATLDMIRQTFKIKP